MASPDQDPSPSSSHSDSSMKQSSRKGKKRKVDVAETLNKWKEYYQKPENIEKQAHKSPRKGSTKGCASRKRGPENANCNYKGVRQRKWGNWVAEIKQPDKGDRLWLGTFPTAIEAALAYDEAARTIYGPHARLNLPDYNTSNSTSNPTAPGSDSNTMSNTISEVSPHGVNLKSDAILTKVEGGESESHPKDGMADGEAVVSKIEKKQLDSQNICPSQEADDIFDLSTDEFFDFDEEQLGLLEEEPLDQEGQASVYDIDLDFPKHGKD